MALAGSAAGSALTKLKATLEGDIQAEVVSEKIEKHSEGDHKYQDKSLTHHYKITRTQSDTIEVDDSSGVNKLSLDDKKVEKTKNKKSGCFGRCFGKKG